MEQLTFGRLAEKYSEKVVNNTPATAEDKDYIEDLFTEFGDELLFMVEDKLRSIVDDMRFKS